MDKIDSFISYILPSLIALLGITYSVRGKNNSDRNAWLRERVIEYVNDLFQSMEKCRKETSEMDYEISKMWEKEYIAFKRQAELLARQLANEREVQSWFNKLYIVCPKTCRKEFNLLAKAWNADVEKSFPGDFPVYLSAKGDFQDALIRFIHGEKRRAKRILNK